MLNFAERISLKPKQSNQLQGAAAGRKGKGASQKVHSGGTVGTGSLGIFKARDVGTSMALYRYDPFTPVSRASAHPSLRVFVPSVDTQQRYVDVWESEWSSTRISTRAGGDLAHLFLLPDWLDEGSSGAMVYAPDASTSSSTDILDELLRLVDGWDGDGSVAPSRTIKSVAMDVFSRLGAYIHEAETEVDSSSGEVTFTWFFEDDSSVSVNVLPDGRVVVVEASLRKPSRRTVLTRPQFDRLERVAVDAGLHRLHG